MVKAKSHVRTAAGLAQSRWFQIVARAGYVTTGLVHAMIGWICLRLGLWRDADQSADQSGALASFAEAPAGAALLLAGAVATAMLAAVHVLASVGDLKNDLPSAVKAAGKAVLYGGLAVTAWSIGSGQSSDSGDTAESATAPLLASGLGRALVILAGAAIIAVGVYHVYKGTTRKFRNDLSPSGDDKISSVIDMSGLVGYVAKGLALVGVGGMVMWAAISVDPDKARGLDAAFTEVLSFPAGGYLLAGMGIGFVLFGVYSVLRAKYQQMPTS
ncbi:DUF1206 domain-containing protein [Flaviflexus equikiangi]|uniref:DUF1206 domain-containing protein n=1 Tax=Flaviflexus equikiangi TaxID=2758573 RepID=UPI0015F3B571|nr:DUF1206 domain-containing protein [Flaviflexus equikiangi]